MQVIDAARFDIVQLFLYAPERAGKRIHVHQHADHLMSLVPARIRFAHPVQFAQRLRPPAISTVEHGDKVIVGLHIAVVQLAVEPLQFILMPRKAA